MDIGKVIFYDKVTGQIIVDTGQWENVARKKSLEEQIATYKELSDRNRATFDYIELRFGQYAQDFVECSGYRVNPDTKQIEFSYPDTNETEPSEPVYQVPLSEQIAELKQENILLKAQNNVLVERTDFHEEVLSEIIVTINS